MKKLLSILCVAVLLASCQKPTKQDGTVSDTAQESTTQKQSTMENLTAGVNKVTFKSFGVDLVGNLYLPEGFDPNKKYTAIVGGSPFPQVKEQSLSIYGQAMAERDFVFLAFDYIATGESPALPGEHKPSRNMFRMIENTWDAVSYLGSLPFVEDINALGVCQGGSVVASSVVTDRRIKKFATIAGIMAMNEAYASNEVRDHLLTTANNAKQEMYETGEPVRAALNGFRVTDDMTLEEAQAANPGRDVKEYFEYYGKGGIGGLGKIENFTHSQIADVNMGSIMSIGESYADKIVQPSLTIYGEKSPLAFASINFVKKLTNEHEVLALPEYGQIEFYHQAEVVKISADAVATFFNK